MLRFIWFSFLKILSVQIWLILPSVSQTDRKTKLKWLNFFLKIHIVLRSKFRSLVDSLETVECVFLFPLQSSFHFKNFPFESMKSLWISSEINQIKTRENQEKCHQWKKVNNDNPCWCWQSKTLHTLNNNRFL